MTECDHPAADQERVMPGDRIGEYRVQIGTDLIMAHQTRLRRLTVFAVRIRARLLTLLSRETDSARGATLCSQRRGLAPLALLTISTVVCCPYS